jgi:hypothetical protein
VGELLTSFYDSKGASYDDCSIVSTLWLYELECRVLSYLRSLYLLFLCDISTPSSNDSNARNGLYHFSRSLDAESPSDYTIHGTFEAETILQATSIQDFIPPEWDDEEGLTPTSNKVKFVDLTWLGEHPSLSAADKVIWW